MTAGEPTNEQTPETPKASRPRIPQVPGLTYGRMTHWIRKGYLRPQREMPNHPGGTGNRYVWPQEELRIARDMVRLRAVGVGLEQAHAMARAGTARVRGALRTMAKTKRAKP